MTYYQFFINKIYAKFNNLQIKRTLFEFENSKTLSLFFHKESAIFVV